MEALDDQESEYRLGPAFDQTVATMGSFLAKSPIERAQGVTAKIGERIVLQNGAQTTSVYVAPPVDYVFDRTGAKSAE
ncbi:hypothetical protein ABTJ50_21410, partial [Acinetobacter baumannii]